MIVSADRTSEGRGFRSPSGDGRIRAIREEIEQPWGCPGEGPFAAETQNSISFLKWRSPATGIVVERMLPTGAPGMIGELGRPGDASDLIFVSYGAGPVEGKVAGSPFELDARRSVRTSYVPEGCDGLIRFRRPARSLNLAFPMGYLAGLVEELPRQAFRPLMFRTDEQLLQLVRMMAAEISAPGPAPALMTEGLARAIAAVLTRLDLEATAAEAERIHLPLARIRRVQDHVEENLAREIGLRELAAVAQLSPFHFSRVFKRATGITPHQMVAQRRLDRACRLLSEGSLPLAEIARTCGYANQSHFTAVFGRALGMPPGRYRALNS